MLYVPRPIAGTYLYEVGEPCSSLDLFQSLHSPLKVAQDIPFNNMSPTFTHKFDTSLYKGSIAVNTGLFINGQFVDAVDKQTIEYVPSFLGVVLS